MKKYIKYLLFLLPIIILAACVEEYSLEANPPTAEDAQFTFQPTEESENILRFTSNNEFFLMKWDLGNGSTGSGRAVTGTYPSAGTYTVTLTVFNKGGSASYSEEVIIENTDPLLLDLPLYNMLTGGADAPEGKTWVLDASRAGHFGVGPNPSQAGDFPEWYQAGPFEKEGGGMYDDRYTFFLADFAFNMETNGNIYINAAQASNFPGSFESNVGDFTAPYTAPSGLTWNIAEPENSYPELTISNGGFIGYFAGGRTYQIVNIEENQLFLRFVDQANDGLAWYIRLVPEGFEGGGEEPEPEPQPEPGEVNITLQNLIGEGQKAWKLKPAAGAFGVGPAPGSDEYYPNGQDISGDRACLFNDLFIFGQDGFYAYDPQGDIFGESYMGVEAEGCQDVANLSGTPGAA
ncbi:MAG TPA: PKD domain-containing protein, partial [Anditalea sp.]|nr:PKD domain-containing protein [Anditalea sp.]